MRVEIIYKWLKESFSTFAFSIGLKKVGISSWISRKRGILEKEGGGGGGGVDLEKGVYEPPYQLRRNHKNIQLDTAFIKSFIFWNIR